MANPSPHDVAIICNPQAGGRWHVLADVLDSDEAKAAHRVVTDDIEDIREALAGLGQRVKLLCIYGGDGTIFGVINELLRQPGPPPPRLALLGGGTMNVTAAWLGMSRAAGENFRTVMRAYLADRLQWREVPLLAVENGGRTAYGFTFGLGPLVRVIREFDKGPKSPLRGVALGVRSVLSALTGIPRSYQSVLAEMEGHVVVDGEALPARSFTAVFANITGAINPGVTPFIGDRTRDTFHFLAYSSSSREFAAMAPLLARAQLPVDPRALLPASLWRHALRSLTNRAGLPTDPRYVNHPAHELCVETPEDCYTIDGEVLATRAPRFAVRLGPQLQLATLPGPLLRRLIPEWRRRRRPAGRPATAGASPAAWPPAGGPAPDGAG